MPTKDRSVINSDPVVDPGAIAVPGEPLHPAIPQALDVGMQASDVLPQLVAMGGMSFLVIVRAVVQCSMFALQVVTGAEGSR